jgi:hypothetical protein
VAPDPRLVRAKARLDRLDWYPEPVRIDRVRIAIAPWFFRLPGLRRFDGYAWPWLILLRSASVSDDLITHELCHVWQLQHRPLALVLSYPLEGYAGNRFEVQARRAAALTRERPRDAS